MEDWNEEFVRISEGFGVIEGELNNQLMCKGNEKK